MGDLVNAGFARSEQLKSEWDTLKLEMSSLDPSDPPQSARRTAIHARMNQITAEMAAVITQTRKILPTPDIDDDDEGPVSPHVKGQHRPHVVQYSARNLHVIQRTYDSSEDDADDDLLDVQVPTVDADELDPLAPEESRQESYVDAEELRRNLMQNATSSDTVVTVEGRLSPDRGLRGLGHLLMDKLKLEATPGAQATLSEEEREQRTLELSRLGREVRKLKRIPERSKQEQKKLDDLSARVAKLSERLGQTGADDGMSPGESGGTGTAATPQAGGQEEGAIGGGKSRKNAMFGGRHSKSGRATGGIAEGQEVSREAGLTEEEMQFEAAEDVSPKSTLNLGNNAAPSKRKKGWMALEAGVASIRALGRTVRTSTLSGKVEVGKQPARADPMSPGANKPPASAARKSRAAGAEAGGGGNAFAEAAMRVKQRGEKLGAAADGSEQMANDAGDMLSAVRALRQRNNKGGLFS